MQIDELWESLSQSAITVLANASTSVHDADTLLTITNAISVFIQTMEVSLTNTEWQS